MNHYPKILIVTPSFNQGEYIEERILSVINQNYPKLEYIIIDGGSTNGTVDFIRKYKKHINYWVSKPDNGQNHANNKGLSKTKGQVFGQVSKMAMEECRLYYTLAKNQTSIYTMQGIPSISTIHDVQELYFPQFFTSSERARRAVHYKKAIDEASAVIVSYNHIKKDIINFFLNRKIRYMCV